MLYAMGPHWNLQVQGGGGSTSRLGGRELTLLCGFNQYTLLQNRDNSGLLGTSLYCSLKLGGGDAPPMLRLGGGRPPCPPCGAPPEVKDTDVGTSHYSHYREAAQMIIGH